MSYTLITTSGELSNLDATLVSKEVQLAALVELPWPRIFGPNWVTVSEKGRTHQFAQSTYTTAMAALSEADSTGMDSGLADYTTTSRTIALAVKGRDHYFSLLAAETGIGDLSSHVTDTLKKGYFKRVNTDVMAQYAECSGTAANIVGSAGTPVTYADHFIAGLERLAVGSAPAPYFWVVPTTQISDLGTESQFAEFQKLGQAWLDQNIVLPTGYLGIAPFGVEVYFCNEYTSSTGDHGMMFSREAFKFLEKMPFTVSVDNTEYLLGARATKFGATTIYGFDGVRDTSTTNSWVVDILS